MDLKEIRSEIDRVDNEIITLLSKRSAFVAAAGALKKDEQRVRDPARVEQVIDKVRTKAASAGLDPAIAEEIYRTISGCFVRKELAQFNLQKQDKKAAGSGVGIRKVEDRDSSAVAAIFNHYVEHSFAAYPDKPVDVAFVGIMKTIVHGDAFYVMEMPDGEMAGFAFLKKYSPSPAFNRTAEVGYFILPEFTRKGLGRSILDHLEHEARALGIDTLLANISSHNQPSLDFHEKNGFRECGRFRRISRKFGQDVDIVWMQKFIALDN